MLILHIQLVLLHFQWSKIIVRHKLAVVTCCLNFDFCYILQAGNCVLCNSVTYGFDVSERKFEEVISIPIRDVSRICG